MVQHRSITLKPSAVEVQGIIYTPNTIETTFLG